MQIRKATEKDIDEILNIYERARKYMAENNNPNQWIKGYPQKELVLEDINKGISHVYIIDGQIEGVFVLLEENDPTYNIIEGAWLNDEPYVAIHRVASKGTHRGVLSDIVDWCQGKCENIRIDTHKDNVIMQHLLEKKGFVKCGIIYLANGAPRIAYHRKGYFFMADILFMDSEFNVNEFVNIEKGCFAVEPYGEAQFPSVLDSLYWVERINGIAVGYLYVNRHDSILHIHRLAVLADYRRRGLGSFLLDSLLNYARTNDAKTCLLSVDSANTPAFNLYIKKGFNVIGAKCRYTFNTDTFNSNNGVEAVKGAGEERFDVTFVKDSKVIGTGRFNTQVVGCKNFDIYEPEKNAQGAIYALKAFIPEGCDKISIMTENKDVISVLKDVPCVYKKELLDMVLEL